MVPYKNFEAGTKALKSGSFFKGFPSFKVTAKVTSIPLHRSLTEAHPFQSVNSPVLRHGRSKIESSSISSSYF
jgi:hypothetical protein